MYKSGKDVNDLVITYKKDDCKYVQKKQNDNKVDEKITLKYLWSDRKYIKKDDHKDVHKYFESS